MVSRSNWHTLSKIKDILYKQIQSKTFAANTELYFLLPIAVSMYTLNPYVFTHNIKHEKYEIEPEQLFFQSFTKILKHARTRLDKNH